MTIKPLNGYILIEPVEEQEMLAGNIIIPDLGKEKPAMGKVIEVSDFYNFQANVVLPSEVKVGDTVLIPKVGSQRITLNAKEYFVCKTVEVIAIIEN
jgi:chaperonin GroES